MKESDKQGFSHVGIFIGSVRPGAIIRMVAGIEYVTYLNTVFSPDCATAISY